MYRGSLKNWKYSNVKLHRQDKFNCILFSFSVHSAMEDISLQLLQAISFKFSRPPPLKVSPT